MISLQYLVFIALVLKIVIGQSNEGCINPKNENGYCINIKRCTLLTTMLQNDRRNATVIKFVRDSACGYEGRDPKVCCPIRTEVSNNNNNGNNWSSGNTNNGNNLNNGNVNVNSGLGNGGTPTRPESFSNYETVSSSKLPSRSSCGRINATLGNKIVGGQPAALGDWPWIAAIGYTSINAPNNPPQWLCGGTLISDRYVVTAAHCTVGIGQRKISVARLGDLDLDSDVNDGASPVDVPVERVITHENYNSQDYTNDIAVLKLKRSVSFNYLIQPICLPIMSDIRANQFVKYIPKVAGWGTTSYRGPTSTVLMEAPVPVVENAECKRAYANKKTVIDERTLCAGYKAGGIDACQGDSGGPLVTPISAQNYLIGVVSFGFKCADPDFPGVYSRVSYFVDWIVEKINNSYIYLFTWDFVVRCKKLNETINQRSTIQTISFNKTLSYSKLPSSSSCGRINASPSFRIIGGQPAELGNWPWIVALGYTNNNTPNNPPGWFCSGTLISDRYVVTAAQCVVGGIGQKKLSVVRLGELDLNSDISDGASPIDVPVEKVLIHEEYNSRTHANDIAVLKLKNSISFNSLIQPICLPISSDLRTKKFVKSILKIAGWGTTSYRGSQNTRLMEAPVSVFDNVECQDVYANKSIVIDERNVCAGDKNGQTDSCRGDSGGPMVVEVKAQHYLIGVVSFGVKCGDPNFPGVYSRIAYFVDWIVKTMNSS
ncbi:transmembrane protease serine 9-like [Daktulosphaira vitifoliae]|uniref:transmembrane protease serine 9-like n=1 Tax=Daktulosphaira vitifoliae TaxID=58002 RepID=UPI0021AA9A95|nr:transmembrane protease serine 9-like [Daktulosphaira vitifoliae]